jgi:large subunit ribosomal protein L21
MYAVVDIAGHQYQVEEGAVVRVPKLDLPEGSRHTLDDILLVRTDNATHVGCPHLDGARVEATVIGHGRGAKVIIFKLKRRKNYRRRAQNRGYRRSRLSATEIERP